jgi:hypothetical protein
VVVAVVVVAALVLRAEGQAVVSDLFDAPRMLADLEQLSSDALGGRAVGSAGNAQARALIVSRFRELALAPLGAELEAPFAAEPAAAGRRGRPGGVNVVGVVKGTRTPQRYLVMSAHYDHVGTVNGVVFNGANDNASGAAALAAIASYFVTHPPANSIAFVAFDAEESGLSGSRAFVASPPVPLTSIVANVNADMVGRDADRTLYFTGTRRFPMLRPFAMRVAASAPIRVLLGHDGEDGAQDWTGMSDQWSFMEAGVPALYVGVDDQAYLHKATDDFASMMPDFYVRAVDALIALVRELDEAADEIVRARARS